MNTSASKVINVSCGELCKSANCDSKEINLFFQKNDGNESNVYFGYEKFVKQPENIPPKILDLIQIASYIFCTDRMSRRSSRDSINNDSWSRIFNISIPVIEIDFWNSESTKKALNEALVFMTGDRKYEFNFFKSSIINLPAKDLQPLLFNEVESEVITASDADIMLFSGGLDSLAGAIEHLNENPTRKICLISHRASTNTKGIQDKLINNLKIFYENRILKYGFECHIKKLKTKDETQRTRMFLFSSIAFAICDRLQKNELFVYENGITSMNLPLQADVINSRASRTTHPKTLHLLENLFKLINPDFKIIAPYRNLIKSDIIEIFRKYNAKQFISSSISCSSTRNKPKLTPHCGVCSQCIDRRFAMYAIGLDDEDCNYETDFITNINSNGLNNFLFNLLKFANEIKKFTSYDLLKKFPTEIYEIVMYWKEDKKDDKLDEILALLNRYADSVWEATKAMVAKHFDPKNKIVNDSLLKIITDQGYLNSNLSGDSKMKRDEIFISYSHKDLDIIEELKPFLDVLARDYNIEYWYDKMISSGANSNDTIKKHLKKSKVAILLVSQDFLASNFIHYKELPNLVEAANNEGAKLFWLPIRPCNWQNTVIEKFQAAAGTDPKYPLSKMDKSGREEIYVKLSDEIKNVFK
jgi:7-cyano-7-deazaguanine synthase in queuosine biosynthesis